MAIDFGQCLPSAVSTPRPTIPFHAGRHNGSCLAAPPQHAVVQRKPIQRASSTTQESIHEAYEISGLWRFGAVLDWRLGLCGHQGREAGRGVKGHCGRAGAVRGQEARAQADPGQGAGLCGVHHLWRQLHHRWQRRHRRGARQPDEEEHLHEDRWRQRRLPTRRRRERRAGDLQDGQGDGRLRHQRLGSVRWRHRRRGGRWQGRRRRPGRFGDGRRADLHPDQDRSRSRSSRSAASRPGRTTSSTEYRRAGQPAGPHAGRAGQRGGFDEAALFLWVVAAQGGVWRRRCSNCATCGSPGRSVCSVSAAASACARWPPCAYSTASA